MAEEETYLGGESGVLTGIEDGDQDKVGDGGGGLEVLLKVLLECLWESSRVAHDQAQQLEAVGLAHGVQLLGQVGFQQGLEGLSVLLHLRLGEDLLALAEPRDESVVDANADVIGDFGGIHLGAESLEASRRRGRDGTFISSESAKLSVACFRQRK